jgi:hypothetical protein
MEPKHVHGTKKKTKKCYSLLHFNTLKHVDFGILLKIVFSITIFFTIQHMQQPFFNFTFKNFNQKVPQKKPMLLAIASLIDGLMPVLQHTMDCWCKCI